MANVTGTFRFNDDLKEIKVVTTTGIIKWVSKNILEIMEAKTYSPTGGRKPLSLIIFAGKCI